MKLFMSSMNRRTLKDINRILPNKKVNSLITFGGNLRENELFFNGNIPNLGLLMLDCGTFSLHFASSVTEQTVSIEKYIAYLHKRKKYIDYYSNFDRNFTIHGFKDNLEALKTMEKAGLHPFPVIHDYYNEEIPYYLDHGYEFLALGSIMQKGSDKRDRKKEDIEYALSRIDTEKIKVHLFGASSYKMIANLPLYSCDSSSWAQNNKYGFILFWNPNNAGDDKTDKIFFCDKMKDHFRNDRTYFETYGDRPYLENYIESLGFNYYDLMGYDADRYRQLLNAIYYLTIEEIITKAQFQKKALAA